MLLKRICVGEAESEVVERLLSEIGTVSVRRRRPNLKLKKRSPGLQAKVQCVENIERERNPKRIVAWMLFSVPVSRMLQPRIGSLVC
jgi:hypothetical protein